MVGSIVVGVLVATALVVTIPSVTAAQDEGLPPEGTEWHLVSYIDDGELRQVPWYVDATLFLEGGRAGGSAGCNALGGTYTLEGDSLSFDYDIGILTDIGCGAAWLDVESGYIDALPATMRWAFDTGPTGERALYLYDADDDIILRYEQPVIGFTRADIYALATEIDALRDRIKRLERRMRRDEG